MVPVLDNLKKPLMPCSEKRARRLMEKGEAKPYWYQGIFCIILQKDPSSRSFQDVGVGVDPGSKRKSFVGGTSKGLISLHSMDTGKRLTQGARKSDLKILSRLKWRTAFLPALKDGVSSREN